MSDAQRVPDYTRVLNHGFVELVAVHGNDKMITDAARVSYDNSKRPPSSDNATLLRYLMRHEHMTPFEMPVLQFRVHCPISTARQWCRHRTWSFNEASTRYAAPCEDVEIPTPDAWRRQSKSNKQGSSGYFERPKGATLEARAEFVTAEARRFYDDCVSDECALEQARDILPLGTYTTFIGQVNLRNLLAFLMLRCDPHAQHEIRVYANAIADMVALYFPITWQAFVDYRMKALTLTRQEVEALKAAVGRYGNIAFRTEALHAFAYSGTPTARERAEFVAKLERFGLIEEESDGA